ncbi:UPF0182 family protein [Synechococcus elongatus IITB4]|uniref:UPF0182 family protein n=1 Tax=Synechococcus elongatus TaxID=32046 RepID=UPI0030D11510
MPRHWSRWGIAIAAILLGLGMLTRIHVETLWFAELGIPTVFLRRLGVQVLLFSVAGLAIAAWIGGNLRWAARLQATLPDRSAPRLQLTGLLTVLSLLWLALLALTTQAVIAAWTCQDGGALPLLPKILTLDWLQSPLITERTWPLGWGLVIGLGSLVLFLWRPWPILIGLSTITSLAIALFTSREWLRIWPALAAESVSDRDPIFQQDLAFYLFRLPALEVLQFDLWIALAFSFCAVLAIYYLANHSVSNAEFRGFAPTQQRHLVRLTVAIALFLIGHCWLAQRELLFSELGAVYGIGFTDRWIKLPLLRIWMALFGIAAIALFWKTRRGLLSSRWIRNLQLGAIASVLMWVTLPAIVQQLVVQPNELARELPYLKQAIVFTRRAFGLDQIETRTFDPQPSLNRAVLRANRETVQNIRLWDTRPLLQSNRQLQQIRLYYSFPTAQIDRYLLQTSFGKALQQVIIAARELDYTAIPAAAKTWVNEHLIYTHGYGFTLSPVNSSAPDGLPHYFVKDIGANTRINGDASLGISAEAVKAAISVENPRIYYGQLTRNYVFTPSRTQELDYPSGNDNAYNVYDGSGGVQLGNYAQRLLFALYLRDWRLPFSGDLTAQTRVLFRRQIKDRVRAIAPFLRYDAEPYLVTVNSESAATAGLGQSSLFWILDAYTVSDRYPYADPGEQPFNYIRNSVKVVIDAYNGSAKFYIVDPSDPLIRTWSRLFPTLFQPLDAMAPILRSHLRYPTDLFKAQSSQLLTYHVLDPQVFYNRDDQWAYPLEIYAGETATVQPYYLITRLPTAEGEEFLILTPFTPLGRNNMIAWLAGRSDGDQYGRLLLYEFPRQRLIFGPEQITARINQDPRISEQITLWNREGSRAAEGNLLVIPIEQSLLYVEPLYLEASRNSLPALTRVIAAYQDRIVMTPSLVESLKQLFPEPNLAAEPTAIAPSETD